MRRYFFLSAQEVFVTKFLTHVTNFVTHITNFVIHVTNFVTNFFLVMEKNILLKEKNSAEEIKILRCKLPEIFVQAPRKYNPKPVTSV